MSRPRPRTHEVESMTVVELIDNLISDQSNAAIYRSRLIRLMWSAGSKTIASLLPDAVGESVPEEQPELLLEAPDLRILIASRKANGELVPFVRRLASSNWDKMDPAGKMYKTPDEICEFLQDVLENNWSYEDLSPGQRALMDTISHSFSRWLQNQR